MVDVMNVRICGRYLMWLLLLLILMGATKCGAVPVAATGGSGGVAVYTGMHPPAQQHNGVWVRAAGTTTWKYLPWAAAGALAAKGVPL